MERTDSCQEVEKCSGLNQVQHVLQSLQGSVGFSLTQQLAIPGISELVFVLDKVTATVGTDENVQPKIELSAAIAHPEHRRRDVTLHRMGKGIDAGEISGPPLEIGGDVDGEPLRGKTIVANDGALDGDLGDQCVIVEPENAGFRDLLEPEIIRRTVLDVPDHPVFA